MATRKPASKSKLIPIKSKATKVAQMKKAAVTPAIESPTAKDVTKAAISPAKQKIKLVRDSFTIPKGEYLALSDLKLRSVRLGREAKKSEILRAGIAVLSKMPDSVFKEALDAIPNLKTGRPKDSKKVGNSKTAKKDKTSTL